MFRNKINKNIVIYLKYIKIYTFKNQVNFSSEQIILFGLLKDHNSINIEPHNYNYKNQSRYDGVIETCNKLFIYVDSIKECDIIVFPYKLKGANDNNLEIYLVHHKI